MVVTTAGTNAGLTQGWALMETIFLAPGPGFVITPGANVAGTVLFLRPPTVSRPIEVSEPLDFSLSRKWVLPFDHTNGYSSGVALVNQETFQDISIFITFYDGNGNQIASDSFTLLRGNHLSFTSTVRYPQTIGAQGTIRIESSSNPLKRAGLPREPVGPFYQYVTHVMVLAKAIRSPSVRLVKECPSSFMAWRCSTKFFLA